MLVSTRLAGVFAKDPAAAFQGDFDGLTYAYVICSDDLPPMVDPNRAATHVQGCMECLENLARWQMIKMLVKPKLPN